MYFKPSFKQFQTPFGGLSKLSFKQFQAPLWSPFNQVCYRPIGEQLQVHRDFLSVTNLTPFALQFHARLPT